MILQLSESFVDAKGLIAIRLASIAMELPQGREA